MRRKKSRYRKGRSGLTISRKDADRMTAKYSGIDLERFFGVDGYVGNTPLIRLRRLSELTGCEILGKAEFMNPAGSVKDRAAYGIIADAEQQGWLKPGATIVEGTAGNTGIGLAVIGRARGYRTVIVIPNNQSPEKMHLLRTLGAEVKAVPEKPYKDPENYNHIARRLAEERGWFWANQFDNTANRDTHYRSTGPEIWKQTEGKVRAFVAAIGTGGTLAGVSVYVKKAYSSAYPAALTLPERCASPKNPARVKPSSPFFATQATNINQRSSIATGSLPIISIRTFLWNRFSARRVIVDIGNIVYV